MHVLNLIALNSLFPQYSQEYRIKVKNCPIFLKRVINLSFACNIKANIAPKHLVSQDFSGLQAKRNQIPQLHHFCTLPKPTNPEHA